MTAPEFIRTDSAESLLDLPEYALLAAAAALVGLAVYAFVF
ncbi:MAG TPA: hypothetical protein VHG51_18615 [Longimicrobiaceae bacterium]|nr:hypothetical protein [Longimicrobiaceae bacterium]